MAEYSAEHRAALHAELDRILDAWVARDLTGSVFLVDAPDDAAVGRIEQAAVPKTAAPKPASTGSSPPFR
jgi:hypothetical protein